MNRRKAIFRISLAGLGIATAGTVYKWRSLVKRPDLDYARQHKELVAALSETILPATDTPGAKDLGVEDFILRMIRDCTPRREQNTFISGLQDVQDHCRNKFGCSYQLCSASEQQLALSHFEARDKPYKGIAGKLEYRLMGRSFFAILKDYTVQGYCTSERGATKSLAYLYIPGGFRGCIPLQPGQKAWATN